MEGGLEDQINLLLHQNRNVDGRCYVPEAALNRLMTEDLLYSTLTQLRIERYHIPDLIKAVVDRARKVFAILLVIYKGEEIVTIFQHDSLQNASLDGRLPYSAETLKQLFPSPASELTRLKFFDMQYHFAIPHFTRSTLPRALAIDMVLPINSQKFRGQGSFGEVWDIELHPDSHMLSKSTNKFVQKISHPIDSGVNKAYYQELENLSLLRHLQHPNIVELLCSYEYRGRHHFIFPAANLGDLSELLGMETRPRHFSRDGDFIVALEGLASALNSMHNFTTTLLDLRLTGRHHDLAPRNILVDGGRLLLADFGLSRLQDLEKANASTSFKETRGYYVAPECQAYDGSFQSYRITSKSDIWSFGCILMEVLTYMAFGSPGVTRFEAERRYERSHFVSYRFHHGPGQRSPVVESWLRRLESHFQSRPLKCFVALVEQILSIKPEHRPDSTLVYKAIRYIAIEVKIEPVNVLFAEIQKACSSIEASIEYRRFRSWAWVFRTQLGQLFDSLLRAERTASGDEEFDFANVAAVLNSAQEELREISSLLGSRVHSPSFVSLKWHNTNLYNALPPQARSFARSRLEAEILDTGSADLLEATHHAMVATASPEIDEQIGMLVAVKRMTVLAEQRALACPKDIQIDPNELFEEQKFDQHSLAQRIVSTASDRPYVDKVVIEWLRYSPAWGADTVGDELRSRVEAIAALLSSDGCDGNTLPSVLRCQGFFHEPLRFSFGLVYTIPSPAGSSPIVAAGENATNSLVTLHQVLSKEKSMTRPLLNDRFRIAYKLAMSVLTFHKVGWLHKALVSSNVLFRSALASETTSAALNIQFLQGPYLIGFSRSRQEDEHAFTTGPDESDVLRMYQHPDYLQLHVRYRHEFDYYSLGMLLLEIGLWNRLSSITAGKEFQVRPHEFRDIILSKRLPRLGQTMGTNYRDATWCCLTGEFCSGSGPSAEVSAFTGNVDLYSSFEINVIEKLKSCLV